MKAIYQAAKRANVDAQNNREKAMGEMKKQTLQNVVGYAVMSAFWLLFGYCLLMWWTT